VPDKTAQLIGQVLILLIALPFRLIFGATAVWRRVAARRRAFEAERKAEAQRHAWLAMVQRQHVRGTAGDASQADARAALSGRGGRPNPLDDRWFE
jgi:hypothetical protein